MKNFEIKIWFDFCRLLQKAVHGVRKRELYLCKRNKHNSKSLRRRGRIPIRPAYICNRFRQANGIDTYVTSPIRRGAALSRPYANQCDYIKLQRLHL